MGRARRGARTAAPWAASAALVLCLAACPLTERALVEPTGQKETLPEQVARLEQLVARLEAESKQARTPDPQVARRVADLGSDVQGVVGRVAALEGRMETEKALSAAKEAKGDKETQRLDGLEGRLSAVEKQLAELGKDLRTLAAARAVATAVPVADKASPPAASERPPTAQTLYDEAYTLYKKQGKYDEARAKFRAVVEADPGAPLAGSAVYWIGETFFDQKEYEQAILEYDRVVQKYPKSVKVPSALLKQALAFDAIADPEDARILLKKILREFPTSDQATLAKKKLEALGE